MSTVSLHDAHQLKVWEKVEIVIGEGDQAGHYLARIQDFLNGGIVVTEPEFLHGHSLLTENSAVTVVVTREDAVYQFSSAIKRVLSKAKQQYLLNPPRHIERVQRRLFVRVELTKKMSWARIVPVAEWQSLDDRSRWTQTSTVDISGGGVLFRANDLMEAQTRLLLKVSTLSEIGLPETVAAITMRGFTRKNEYYCGAAFILADQVRRYFSTDELRSLPAEITAFDINAQNRLVSHIFQLQVSLRRKGLL
ncbi:MAG: flagellar brake domain-containing protein [candidate division Zixibacteria bacterium]|nr:flagellar brake domain-containing protein [candidate division Zixibacteria bacterium]